MSTRRGSDAIIIASMVQGAPRAMIAERASVSERTLRRRLKEPAMVAALADARADHHRQVLARLQQLSVRAMEEVEAILTTADASTRLRAARLVLEQCTRYRAAAEDARLASLETVQAQTQIDLEGRFR